MKMLLYVLIGLIGLVTVSIFAVNSTLVVVSDKVTDSSHYQTDKFINAEPIERGGIGTFITILMRSLTEERLAASPDTALPVDEVSREQLDALSNDAIHFVKLGHSTVLFKVYGEYWLADPMFGTRASPFSFMGPERFDPPAMALEQLPPIERVLISHNHYDHLDKQSIIGLKEITRHFYVPLGVAAQLVAWGVDEHKIEELDWNDSRRINQGKLVFTPAHHFSGRGLTDTNQTLWGSWTIIVRDKRIFFSGDSGYFSGFKAIGEQYGPFDLAFIENGAYGTNWPDVHMFPNQSIQAFDDLKGKHLVPIHNSTFDLAFHDWYAPLDQISQAASRKNISLLTPRFGQIMTLDSPMHTSRWWEKRRKAAP